MREKFDLKKEKRKGVFRFPGIWKYVGVISTESVDLGTSLMFREINFVYLMIILFQPKHI